MAKLARIWSLPDRRGIPRELLLLSVTQGLATLGAGMIIPLLAPLTAGVQRARLPETVAGVALTPELQVGLLFSILGVVRSATQVPLGGLSDRLGRRRPFVVVGMGLSAVAIAAYGFVETLLGLYGLRIVHGVALAVATPALMALVERVTEAETRGEGMGVFSTSRTLGWGVGPVVGGAVADSSGTTPAFLTGAVLVALAAFAVRVAVPERPVAPSPEADADGAESASPEDGSRLSARERRTTLLGLAIGAGTLMMGVTAMVAMENPLLSRIDAGATGFGLAFGLTTISRMVTQIPLGRISDSRGRKPLVVAGLLTSAPVVAATGYVESLAGLVAVRAIQGVCLAGAVAPTYALAADAVERANSSRQMAVVSTAFSLGFAVGPPLAGALASRGFAAPFLTAGAAAVVGGVSVWALVDETVA